MTATAITAQTRQTVSAIAVWVVLILLLPIHPGAQFALALPVMVVVHRVIRRRPWSELWHRQPRVRRSAAEWGVLLLLVPVVAAAYLNAGTGSDGVERVWTGTVVVTAVTILHLAVRRGVLVVAAVLTVLTIVDLGTAPRLAEDRTGDPAILAQLAQTHGFHRLAVAVIDLDAATPVRFGNVGSTPTTRFEIGSITKALTGLVVAEAVDRAELRLDEPVSLYLPLGDSPAGRATLRELVTHRAGYPRTTDQDGRRQLVRQPFGVNFEAVSLAQLMDEMRQLDLGPRTFLYSNVGAAAAGQAAASAAHTSYPELMRSRIFDPLQMTDTVIETTPLVSGGHTSSGRPAAPMVMDGLAPTGGAVSTTQDLTKLVVALLNRTAPGLSALDPIAPTDSPSSRIGLLWGVERRDDGLVLTQKNGKTAGYSSYVALDRTHHRAVIVLADVDRGVDMLGQQLLTED